MVELTNIINQKMTDFKTTEKQRTANIGNPRLRVDYYVNGHCKSDITTKLKQAEII